jgi:hypothetical protein
VKAARSSICDEWPLCSKIASWAPGTRPVTAVVVEDQPEAKLGGQRRQGRR